MMDFIKRGGVTPPDDGSHDCTYTSSIQNALRLTLIFSVLSPLFSLSSISFPFHSRLLIGLGSRNRSSGRRMLWLSFQTILFGMYSGPRTECFGRCKEGEDE